MYKEQLAYAQTPERTAAILTDEAALVHHGMLYKEVFPNDITWYASNAKTEAGDLLIQFKLLCEQNEWNEHELESIGAVRFAKRMEELRKGRQE